MKTEKNVMKRVSLKDRMEDWNKIEETLRDAPELSAKLRQAEGGGIYHLHDGGKLFRFRHIEQRIQKSLSELRGDAEREAVRKRAACYRFRRKAWSGVPAENIRSPL